MSKRGWVISIAIVILIGAVIATFGLTNGEPSPEANSTADVDIDTILTHVLNSHTNWDTVQGEAEIIQYNPQGGEQRYIVRFAISQPASARIEPIETLIESTVNLWISDGENIFEVGSWAATHKPCRS